ncbi:protein of unknown function DUF6 transmembrane [Desulfofarcimen acetoxidans DSM 771]|jgi:transporter family protein|uniref:EamA domain-containing protein n=1 Tax=Desulfofarcimen acetoxidans (strain ATCC 49208 / DSM 771 / KCTC 5769 / VKM B-1644 / 5575) TaxID=485916 RepID=C8VY41_DESAS|nr:EamA family transporter [Desulfofarcimen acetoxidans]ACV64670.1 protein of unknown function DUF6 transmembrane [Desulfofarcimen acetoxidans DSM 771]
MVFLYAFLGMLCWGLAPLFGKLGLFRIDPVTALCIRTLMAATLVLGWLVGFWKYNQFFSQVFAVPPLFWAFIAIEAVLATLVGDLAYFAALKWGNINYVTLIMACSPLVTMFLSYIFLSEPVTGAQLIGAVFIITGLIFISLSN